MLPITKYGIIASQGDNKLPGYQYSDEITVPANAVDEKLVNFPVPVQLDETNFNFSNAKIDGRDIIFTDKNKELMKFEKVEYTPRSIFLDGAADFLSWTNDGSFNFGANDFCIEWIEYRYKPSPSVTCSLFNITGSSASDCAINIGQVNSAQNGGAPTFGVSTTGSTWNVDNFQMGNYRINEIVKEQLLE